MGELIKFESIFKDKIELVSQILCQNNLNGLALYSCDLMELRNILKVIFNFINFF